MRFGYLFAIVAVGALVVVSLSPDSAQACWFGHGGGRGYGGYGGYSGGYAAPAPYYPGPGSYPTAPPAGAYYTPAPGGYVVPPPVGIAPRPMPAPPNPAATSVSAKDDSFDPATLNVQVGTTVRWTNNGKHPHTVTSNDGKWDSGDLAPGASYTVTFMTAGTYRYHCKHHKQMEGTIIVGEPGKTPVGGGTGSKGY